jgi:hypothetical protein
LPPAIIAIGKSAALCNTGVAIPKGFSVVFDRFPLYLGDSHASDIGHWLGMTYHRKHNLPFYDSIKIGAAAFRSSPESIYSIWV